MADLASISNAPESDVAMDYARLFALGLEHVRRRGSRQWTDHNTHDPGITILELLCYQLTTLAYRASHPLEDLVAGADGQFFLPQEVLPCRPVTPSDYRKLLIDLPGVRNAWVHEAPREFWIDTTGKLLFTPDPSAGPLKPVRIRGLSRAVIDYFGDPTEPERAAIRGLAQGVLAANRNLCEDFVSVEDAPTFAFSLCAEIEIEPGSDPTDIAAALIVAIEEDLCPAVAPVTLEEALARAKARGESDPLACAFTGPLLSSGFIDDADLAASDPRTHIRLSDVVRAGSRVTGVRSVREMTVSGLGPDGNPVPPADPWNIPLPEGSRPRVDVNSCCLRMTVRGLPLPVDRAVLRSRVEALFAERQASIEAIPVPPPLSAPRGIARDFSSYSSFQLDFPRIYGLAFDEQGNADARQLRAFLLHFDQVMANDAAQIAGLGELLSCSHGPARTYFAQLVDSLPGVSTAYADGKTKESLKAVKNALEAALEPGLYDGADRRERAADHLLARFGEDLRGYVDVLRSAFETLAEETLFARREFIKSIPRLGAERGLAPNRSLFNSDQAWDSGNVSGLERRLCALLDIPDSRRRDLAPTGPNPAIEILPAGSEFIFRVTSARCGAVLAPLANQTFTSPDAAAAAAAAAIERAQSAAFVSGARESQAIATIRLADGADPRTRAAEIARAFRAEFSGEGMYVVENILLRPRQAGQPFLAACADTDCDGCSMGDPYSYQLHFILPAFAGRFRSMDFRRFVEGSIRRECPAHVLPRICWVNEADMRTIQTAYRAWLSVSPEREPAQWAAATGTLITALTASKNVYPPQRLEGTGDQNNGPFVLGRTSLGDAE